MTTPAATEKLVLYVAMAKKRLVIPIHEPTQRVFELGALIAARFRVDRVAELRTGEGFLLDGNDIIREVLRDQQVVSCLDYTGWMAENSQIINDNRGHLWAELEQADFIDDQVKWVRCGWAKNMGKFYIRMGGQRGLYVPMQLDLFEPADLMVIAKKGKHVISQIGDEKTGWYSSAEFVAGADGVVDTVLLRCKSKSDAREAIRSIKIKVNPSNVDKPIEMIGEAKLEQSSELPAEPYNYTEPPAEIKGPSYPDVEEKKVDPKAPKPVAPEIKGEGSLPLLITMKMFPEIDRGYQSSVGSTWNNTISMECEFLNRGESSLILTKWTAEYKDKEGKWQSTKLLRGSRRGFWNYSWERENTDSVPIYGKVPQKFALGVSLPIDAPQLNRARALHSSLPNPLELKFTVADINGGSVSIVIPVSSTQDDLDLITKTKEINNNGNGKACIGYTQCDDTNNEGRIMAVLYRKQRDGQDDEYELRQNLSNSYQTYSDTALKRIAFQAAAKGQSEFKLEDSCNKDGKPGCSMESYALVDVARRRVWAIRVSLSTYTSSVTRTFLVKPPVAAATPVA